MFQGIIEITLTKLNDKVISHLSFKCSSMNLLGKQIPMFEHISSIFTRMIPYKYTGETLPCHLCGSEEKETVGRRDRYGNKLHTALCTNCGLVFTDPMPTDEEVANYYSRFYRKHYHNSEKPTKRAIYKNFKGARRIATDLEPLLSSGKKVLDVGAGGGEFVSYLCDKGIDAEGIEPNQGFANYALETYKVKIQTGMWETADVDDESMDLITAHHVVEHFRNPFGAMQAFHKWLKPGGHLYISVPNIVRPERTPFTRFHFGHVYNFSPKTLRMTALKAGFEEVPLLPTGDTTLVLKKVESPNPNWLFDPDHGREMINYFETYTNTRHFLSAKPYTRWVKRMSRLSKILVLSNVTDGRAAK